MVDKIFQRGVLLKNHTTFKIGGPAEYFFIAKTKEDLIFALKKARELKLPIFILGGGSNVLFSDKGFSGLVIKISNFKSQISNSNKVYAGAGLSLAKLARITADAGLSGFEWSAGIPGATVGGAVFGHAQAFGEKISDWLESVEALDIKNFLPAGRQVKIKKFSKNQCQFSLKNSIFKKNKDLIILSVVFALRKRDKKEIKEKLKGFLEYRKKNHPMDFPSAGSVFINPEIPAGQLIEKSGLKGKKIGKAQISEQHANFIVNLGNAKAEDVLKLINLAKQKVKKMFGIDLETEIQLIGFDKE